MEIMDLLRIATISILLTTTASCSHVERQTQSQDSFAAASPQTFYVRAFHSSIVVGNYLYIDGGEIFFDDGGTIVQYQSNNTYSIDLSSSWTNATISLNRIEKDIEARSLNRPDLWLNADLATFSSYNGELSWFYTAVNPPPNALYRFDPDGSGGGQWAREGVPPDSIFPDLVRVSGAGSACGRGACYAVGGYQSWRTTTAAPFDQGARISAVPVPGTVSFNTSTLQWANSSLAGSVFRSGAWFGGELVFLNNVGDEGILVALGGRTSDAGSTENAVDLDFSSLYMYDIASRAWYRQSTSGVAPSPRYEFCAVTVPGDNNTSEVMLNRVPYEPTDSSDLRFSFTAADLGKTLISS